MALAVPTEEDYKLIEIEIFARASKSSASKLAESNGAVERKITIAFNESVVSVRASDNCLDESSMGSTEEDDSINDGDGVNFEQEGVENPDGTSAYNASSDPSTSRHPLSSAVPSRNRTSSSSFGKSFKSFVRWPKKDEHQQQRLSKSNDASSDIIASPSKQKRGVNFARDALENLFARGPSQKSSKKGKKTKGAKVAEASSIDAIAAPNFDIDSIFILKIFSGNYDFKVMYKTVAVSKQTTAQEILVTALMRFNVQELSAAPSVPHSSPESSDSDSRRPLSELQPTQLPELDVDSFYLSVVHGDSKERTLLGTDNISGVLSKLLAKSNVPGVSQSQRDIVRQHEHVTADGKLATISVTNDQEIKFLLNKKVGNNNMAGTKPENDQFLICINYYGDDAQTGTFQSCKILSISLADKVSDVISRAVIKLNLSGATGDELSKLAMGYWLCRMKKLPDGSTEELSPLHDSFISEVLNEIAEDVAVAITTPSSRDILSFVLKKAPISLVAEQQTISQPPEEVSPPSSEVTRPFAVAVEPEMIQPAIEPSEVSIAQSTIETISASSSQTTPVNHEIAGRITEEQGDALEINLQTSEPQKPLVAVLLAPDIWQQASIRLSKSKISRSTPRPFKLHVQPPTLASSPTNEIQTTSVQENHPVTVQADISDSSVSIPAPVCTQVKPNALLRKTKEVRAGAVNEKIHMPQESLVVQKIIDFKQNGLIDPNLPEPSNHLKKSRNSHVPYMIPINTIRAEENASSAHVDDQGNATNVAPSSSCSLESVVDSYMNLEEDMT